MLNHVLRYEPVVAAVRTAGARSVLEVGSGSRGIASYLREDVAVTACDVTFADYGSQEPGAAGRVRRVEASVLELPFADASFDAVVALDLLEHLPPGERPRAVSELRRVSGVLIVVGCPTGAAALRADRRLAGYVRALHRPLPVWLEEHLRHGFPDRDDVVTWMAGGTVLANERTSTHAVVCALEATPGLWRLPLGLSLPLTAGLARGSRGAALVIRVLRGGDRGPAYRTIVIGRVV